MITPPLGGFGEKLDILVSVVEPWQALTLLVGLVRRAGLAGM
jgi:hypothetical protein